jgi:hypothetical protein
VRPLLALLCFLAAGCNRAPAPETARASSARTVTPSAYDQAFWQTWGDGQAELNGYDLIFPRYGSGRDGVAVAIFVTEPFSKSSRVKADPGRHAAPDVFPVMKLNLVKDYQTGIYDYNDMTSSFLALERVEGRPAGTPTKVSFSSQEWCGHVYMQALFGPQRIDLTVHSYFDGEADQQRSLQYPKDGVSEDVLFFWARGMAEPRLQPGEKKRAPLLLSFESSRGRHEPLTWRDGTLTRSAAKENVKVPAGTFKCERFIAAMDGGESRSFYVEAAAPHKIVKWETSTGQKGELLASQRLKYWELNKPGGEEALKQLGLQPRPRRTN